MPIQIRPWLEQARRRLQDAFGPRLLFLGLQGSYARGEARADSDIDLVVILDEVTAEDWNTYRALLAELPHGELACGFFSGAAELARWDRADLFQFVHDTLPILGDLSALAPPVSRRDGERALRRAACDLYHAAGHNLLHGRSVEALSGLYKSAAFALRAKHCVETGDFLHRTRELSAALSPADRAILEGGAGLTEDTLEARSLALLSWAAAVLGELS